MSSTAPVVGNSFASATRLVAEREIKSFLRMKSFWIGLGFVLFAVFAVTILPGLFDGGPPKVAAVGSATAESLSGKDLEVREVADRATAEQLVRAEDVEAAVVADGSGVRLIALSDSPKDVVTALVAVPPIDLLEPSEVSQGTRQLVVQAFALVFLIFAMGGAAIAQSTVTEKQTRIVEILVSTIPVRALLAGKIIGHALLTIGQVVVIAVAAPIALGIGGHAELMGVIAPALGWFIPFLCLGFVLLAAIWAVAGSLVSRQEDLDSSMGIVVLLAVGPYFGVLFFSDNASVMTGLSYFPFSSAVAMPLRLFANEAYLWEAPIALVLLAGTAALIVVLASRVYSGSLLQTSGKISLAKAWKRVE